MKKYLIFFAALLPLCVAANNIQLSNVSLTGLNSTNRTVQVSFDYTWDHSWRTSVGPANWDAAWIFIKYRRGGVGDWKHAYLNNTGHVIHPTYTIATGLLNPSATFNQTTNPGIGAYVYYRYDNSGFTGNDNTQLQWNFGANGLSNTDLVEIQVFAIEMVYVPQGDYAAGDLGPGTLSDRYLVTTINTANALTIPAGTGWLGGKAGGYPNGRFSIDGHKPLVANYPNGFNAFYCMKYEITQKQYVDFLNTLTYAQQKARVETDLDAGNTITNRYVMSGTTNMVNRNGIKAPPTHNRMAPIQFYCDYNANDIANEANDGLGIACNHLSYEDVCAYLWWAGLRPMTSLEFEKGCRGNLPPVEGEYAWGSSDVKVADISTIFLPGGTGEYFSSTANRVDVTGLGGPSRVGIFAKSSSTRFSAGAAYYGMMEMTGNLTNFVVTIRSSSSTEARSYDGRQGNGILMPDGTMPNAGWPLLSASVARRPVSSTGIMAQDGSALTSVRSQSYGGRGVRTQ